jgi:hypothetical protein
MTARRRSLNAAEDTRLPCRPSTSDGVAEKKRRRYTWAFNPIRSQNDAAAEESHDGLPFPEHRLLPELGRSNSSASLKLQLLSLESRELDPEVPTGSTGSTPDCRPAAPSRPSLCAGTLAPIMEKQYVEITTVAQNRGDAPKVKRWDARTRSTSVWDSLRRVSA